MNASFGVCGQVLGKTQFHLKLNPWWHLGLPKDLSSSSVPKPLCHKSGHTIQPCAEWSGLHFPSGINCSDFWINSAMFLGPQSTGSPFSRCSLWKWKCLKRFSPAYKRVLLECQEPPTQAIESFFFKVTAKHMSLKHKTQFPSFSQPQTTSFQVWGILSSCQYPFLPDFSFLVMIVLTQILSLFLPWAHSWSKKRSA